MIRRKNSNTKVENVEKAYDIDLNSRGDMKLGNLLRKRGFDSQSQLVKAARGQLKEHVRQRRLFLSFHYEDRNQVNGFRLLAYNENSPIDFYDGSVRSAVNSDQSSYLRRVIQEKIKKCSVVVCLIGDGTAGRDWVDWELDTAHIKPFSSGGPHEPENGLLLRSDLHTLFDQGYLTVDANQLKVVVSSRIREEFENGRDYYHLHGRAIRMPRESNGSSAMAWPQFDVVYKRGITLSVTKRLELVLNLRPSLRTCYFAKYG